MKTSKIVYHLWD